MAHREVGPFVCIAFDETPDVVCYPIAFGDSRLLTSGRATNEG